MIIPSAYNSSTYTSYNGGTYPGNRLTIPVGKRLVSTFVSYCPSTTNIPADDFSQGIAFNILKAEGVDFDCIPYKTSRPSAALSVMWHPHAEGSGGLPSSYSANRGNNIFERFGRVAIAHCGSSGYSTTTPIVPYKQGIGVPQEYLSRLPDYPNGDFRRTKGGGFPAQGTLVHNYDQTFTVNNNVGQGWFYPTTNKFINGTPRIYAVLENTSNQLMEVAPVIFYGDAVQQRLEGWFYYRLEDI